MATPLPRTPTKLFTLSHGRTMGRRTQNNDAVVVEEKLRETDGGEMMHGWIEYLPMPCLVMRFGFVWTLKNSKLKFSPLDLEPEKNYRRVLVAERSSEQARTSMLPSPTQKAANCMVGKYYTARWNMF